MTASQVGFVAKHYASRASEYLASTTHSTGFDLDQIEEALKGHSSARVLDLGCGGGHVSYRAAPHVAEVVACDITPEMLKVVAVTAAEHGLLNIAVRQAAAEQLPFQDGEFDVILSRFSAHHWHDLEAGLRETRRVLKLNGCALFVDVVAPTNAMLDTHLQAFELLRDPSHVRDYNPAEWIAALTRSGFAVDGLTARKLRMEFPVWISRTHTSVEVADAVLALQQNAPDAVRSYFDIGDDGSFDLDTATFSVAPVNRLGQV